MPPSGNIEVRPHPIRLRVPCQAAGAGISPQGPGSDAAAGIVINFGSARLFGHDHHHDLNQRAAVLHLLTDAAVSLAVVISALLVGLAGWLRLDAVTALGVGGAVIGSATGLLREAIALNLDAVPRGLDLGAVEALLQRLPGVLAVQVHGAGLTRDQLLAQARQRLEAFGIRRTTPQLGTAAEPDAAL